MDPEQLRKIEALYEAALEVEPAERAAFLAEKCAGDESLRHEVESLLRHAESAGRFLEVPAVGMLPQGARLAVGERVSHYQIQEKLGEGGMGVVYKARDTRLGRSVALKFVKAQFSERFEREARAVAALNHPHIATLHDVGEHEGAPYLAMEFVEGRPLKGPRPVKEVIDYGIQIADALGAAHAAGIIHRDLKPANILITEKGAVKVLDFGLAKLRAQVGEGEPATGTMTGVSAGTPGYMSPEQIDGKRVDSRSDIFTFGCVLYELASGRHAFEGDSVGQVLAATATAEPKPLAGVPEKLDELIRRCLRKDPERRLQHIGDARITLEDLREQQERGQPAAVAPLIRSGRWRRWPWAAAVAAVLLLAAVLVWRLREAAPPSELRPVPLTSYSGIERQPSFSPDGSKVAFVWNGEKEDNFDIYVTQIGSPGPPRRLTTDPAAESNPAWSPDDRWIAFMRQQQGNEAIMLMPSLGGPERKLTELGGVLIAPDSPLDYSCLSWTPDGKWLAFAAQESGEEPSGIWAIGVETGERRRLTTFVTKGARAKIPLGDSSPSFSPDGRTLAFSRQAKTWNADLHTLRLTRDLRPDGEPRQVTDQRYGEVLGLTWTTNGREIVYAAGGLRSESLWRVPVSGQQTPKRLPYGLPGAGFPTIARTPPRLAYTWWVYNMNLWRWDTRTKESRVLIGSSYDTRHPQYSPDGGKIAFTSARSGSVGIWTCQADGTNCVQLTSLDRRGGTPSWSPDGRWLAFDTNAEGQFEICVIAADGGAPRNITNHPADDIQPSWSRDGGWIYFASDRSRSGRWEIWKAPKDGGEAVQVTRSGGYRVFESPDGGYIYYFKSPRQPGLFRMPTEGGPESEFLSGIRLFNMAVTTKGVYFFAPGGEAIQLLDPGTGKVRTLATLDKPASYLAVSPDDAYVVWTQVDRDTQDLMLVEGFR